VPRLATAFRRADGVRVTRRIVWSVVLVLALLTLGASWFVSHFERVPVKEWTPASGEARRDDYLALQRFMERMDRPLIRDGNPRRFDALPADGVLLLDRNRRRHMNKQRVDQIMAWVEQGGYLVVVPEYRHVSDPLLERLDVHWMEPPKRPGKPPAATDPDSEDSDEEDAGEADAATSGQAAPEGGKPAAKPSAKPAAKTPRPPSQIAVTVPGAARPLTVMHMAGLQAGKRRPDWQAGSEEFGQQFIGYAIGRGHVTVAAGFDTLLRNHQIGRLDHAELLWTLLETGQPRGDVVLMSRLAVPTLWEWLVESAGAASASALILLCLWLWRRLVRFGPLIPEPEPGRRQLSEHLAALGRFVWRAGGREHWLAVAREEFQGRLAARHPAIAALAADAQAEALAQLTSRPRGLIAAALHGPAESPHAFTDAIRTLRNLELIL
jgi:hypothetical protein